MKKLVMIFICTLLLFSFLSFSLVLADSDNNNGNQARVQAAQSGNGENENDNGNGESENSNSQGLGSTIRNRVQAGTYTNEQGKEIRVSEMAQNRIRIHSGNATADCECTMTEEQVQNRTRLKMQLSNGKNAEIKVMPDTASETALARLRLRVCAAENNCTIELKEVGNQNRNETRAAYEVQAQKHFKILALFRTKAQVKAQIDAENGEVIRVKKPWWAFLASEEEETAS